MSPVAPIPATPPSGSTAARTSAPGRANHCPTSTASVMSSPHIAWPCAFRSSTAASISSGPGGRISGIGEDLLPDDDLVQHAHAGALVEARCAGRALRVDLERNRALATLEERVEGVPKQSLADAAATPHGTDAEGLDPAPLAVALPVAERGAGELGPVHGDEVERRVVGCPAKGAPLEIFVRPRRVHPAAHRPGLFHRGVDGTLFPGPVGADLDSVRDRGHRPRGEVDDHAPHVARLAEAAPLEERSAPAKRGVLEDGAAGLGRGPALDRVCERGADAPSACGRVDVAVRQEPSPGSHLEIGVAGHAPVKLDDPRVAFEVEALPVLGEIAERPVRAAPRRGVVRTHHADHVLDLLRPRWADDHVAGAGTSSSSVSASRARSGSSRSGGGSGASPNRLIQMVRRPSSRAGAMSWKRLAATCTWPSRGAPVRAKNSSQWRCAGLYEPRSDATTVSSNGTPSRAFNASMKSGSVLERTASRQPRPRASASAAGASGNASHEGSERPSASSSPAGTPPSRARTARMTLRYVIPGVSASTCGSSSW